MFYHLRRLSIRIAVSAKWRQRAKFKLAVAPTRSVGITSDNELADLVVLYLDLEKRLCLILAGSIPPNN
jgi:hypothetical protein